MGQRPGRQRFEIVLAHVLLAALLAGCGEKTAAVDEPSAVPVTVAVPIERETFDFAEFTGETEAVESVAIRARVTGYLDNVCFQDGAEVKKGNLLFEIDPRPFRAKYEEALAQIKLREADLKFRKSELDRASQLLKPNAISGSDYDQSVAAYDQATAALAAARASAEEAKLNLDFTRLLAPIDGEINRALITAGNLVNADQTLLTTIVSVDPMYVYFDVDEQALLRIDEDVRSGKLKVRKAEEVPMQMGLMTEKDFPHEGVMDFAENRLNANTGTIRVRGKFSNPKPALGGRTLKPGYFARLRVPVGEPYKAILIAERALGTDQGQKFVLVVGDKNQVEYRRVTPGKLDGQLRVVQEGVRPGDRVIIAGGQRVRPGMKVTPKLVEIEKFLGAGKD